MSIRILVAYASKYGSTMEIARKVGDVLTTAGLKVDVGAAEKVTDLTPYDAVVLGSAVYAGTWRQEAVKFLEDYKASLTRIPVWLFSSGPMGEGLVPERDCLSNRPVVNRMGHATSTPSAWGASTESLKRALPSGK